MSEWDWFDDYEWEAALAGNQPRVQLARLHREAYQFRESDPDDALRQALAYLDAETPREGDERYLLLGSQRQFALELSELELAERMSQRSLELAAEDADRGRAAHFLVFAHSGLCEIGWRRRDW